jgi:GNAT superfamily N-acetyltransferase
VHPVGALHSYRVVHARSHDLPLLPEIELAAARMLTGHAPAGVLAETTTQFALREARRHGRLWVALADQVPVGFAHVVVHEPGVAHLEELDVHPEHGRRGLGRWLVTTVCTWAMSRGFSAVTLTTFRDVPWNMPFYERLGFTVVPSDEISPALRSVVIDECNRGLDPRRRVVMRRPCDVEHASNLHLGPTTLASHRALCSAAMLAHDEAASSHAFCPSSPAPDRATQP